MWQEAGGDGENQEVIRQHVHLFDLYRFCRADSGCVKLDIELLTVRKTISADSRYSAVSAIRSVA
jgi:hypothetical protein